MNQNLIEVSIFFISINYIPYFHNSNKIIKKVIKGVGKENLEVEVLEFSPDEKTNRENEIKWMLQLNSFVPNGYNLKDEATGGLIDKDGKFVTSWELMTPERNGRRRWTKEEDEILK